MIQYDLELRGGRNATTWQVWSFSPRSGRRAIILWNDTPTTRDEALCDAFNGMVAMAAEVEAHEVRQSRITCPHCGELIDLKGAK